MSNPLTIDLQTLIDDGKCFESVRQLRWAEGVSCPEGQSKQVNKRGFDETQAQRQRYQCKDCQKNFDDLSGKIFTGHHQPLRKWILCLYLMGLNLSNNQIAQELDLNKDDVQQMTSQLRAGIVENKPEVKLSGAVECDEAWRVTALLSPSKRNSFNASLFISGIGWFFFFTLILSLSVASVLLWLPFSLF